MPQVCSQECNAACCAGQPPYLLVSGEIGKLAKRVLVMCDCVVLEGCAGRKDPFMPPEGPAAAPVTTKHM